MKGIKILGALGSRAENANTTCILISKDTVIDAGNIMQGLGEDAKYINNIFFSHSHLDHIVDCAFLLDNFFSTRQKPLKIYALPKTIKTLKKNIFNCEIWPDFTKINLQNTQTPSLIYVPIKYNQEYKIHEKLSLTPIKSNHTVPTCGYIIKNDKNAILFSADTFKNRSLWDIADKNLDIKTIIVDVSFPNNHSAIATSSKHLTPRFLQEDLKYLTRDDVNIYINHIKPYHENKIIQQLEEIGIGREKVLVGGEIILYSSGKIIKQETSTIKKIDKLNNIGKALSSENSIDRLLELIVQEAKTLTGADGGTLYIIKDKQLHFSIIQTDSLNIKMDGVSQKMDWPPISLYLEDGSPNKLMVASMSALENKIINISDVYEAKNFSFDGTKLFDKANNYKSKSMLVIPLLNNDREVIGVLQLINKQNFLYDSIEKFDKKDESLALSLASQAAVAISNITLVKGLEKLLNSFLESVVYAMGKKSPHSAGHIKRMVKLSLMIAEAINKDETVFKDKNYTKDEMEQINFAALVHDIGKLSIPEYIIEKSSKLETVFDRLELVQMRIEHIKKGIEVEFLKGDITETEFLDEIEKLLDYAKFIKRYNAGSEYLSDEDVIKIQNIKDNFYIFDRRKYKILTEDEAEHLSIQKGNITAKEREIINSHAKISLEILNKLPFPKKYRRIPEISASHHEKINGTGYPQGLEGSQISFEARILAIADIFEALTAGDRPYKQANTLSKAMDILYKMAKQNELDKKLVKFFYKSGLYLEYAKILLPKSSIDKIDIDFDSL